MPQKLQEKAERKQKSKREVIHCFYDADLNNWNAVIDAELKRRDIKREEFTGTILCLPENGAFTGLLKKKASGN